MKDDATSDSRSDQFANQNWVTKFRVAISGLISGIKGHHESQRLNSFAVHIPAALMVLIAGVALGVSWQAIGLLMICIGLVLVSELFNSSLELMAKAITDEPNEHIGAALDVASGAVLMASLTALAVGVLVFGLRVSQIMGW